MPIVPNTRLGKIEFYEAHLGPWGTSAVAIGLTTAQVAALATATTAARAAYNAAEAARAASKAATQNFHDKVAAMHSNPGLGADMIDIIKNFAETTNNPNVYNLAQIPPPAEPGPVPPPGTPYKLSVGLLGDGSIELKWKCDNPSGAQGTIYEVLRRFGDGPFAFVGATGVRAFLDDTIPAGSSPVTYQITAVRSTQRGTPAQFLVSFGVGGGGLAITTLTPNVKMAA